MTTVASVVGTADRITERVRERIGQEQFEKYLTGTVSIRVDERGVRVVTPTAFDASWIHRRYGSMFQDAARQELGQPDCAVQFESDPSMFPGRATRASVRAEPETEDRQNKSVARRGYRSGPTLRYSLDTFEVGASNRLAHGAVRALLSEGADPGLSPLFLHGGCGVGKTHLLQGFARAFKQQKRGARVKYVEGESFTNGFVTALRNNSIDVFRRQFRDLDLLCIDDVHFLSNKKATQTEFLHTFNALGLQGSIIAMASDEHPSVIREFSKELSSRFMAGMVVRVDPPDETLRETLVRQMAAARGLVLSDNAVVAVSWHGRESARMIEGAVTRLKAVSTIDPPDGVIDSAYVRRALGATQHASSRRPVRLEAIVKFVASELQVELSELLGRGRHRRVVFARALAGMLARRLTTSSYPEIARALGRPSHSTMVSAVKRLQEQLATGVRFAGGGPHDGMLLEEVLGMLERGIAAS
jgi:chromosomal replication initiator protein